MSDPDTTTNADTTTSDQTAAFKSKVIVALVGGVLVGALLAAAGPRVAMRIGTGGLAYECTPSGKLCECTGILDCLNMGNDQKCKDKGTWSCTGNKCICF